MSLLGNLFGKKQNQDDSSKGEQPDNTRLLKLLHAYRNDESSGNYQRVVDELMNGNAFLLLPTVNGAGAKETSLVLGFKLDLYHENTRGACIQTVQDAVQGEQFEQAADGIIF